jgi:hypothetical protein
MLELQNFLRQNKLENLAQFGISFNKHSKYPNLLSFSYSQVDSYDFRDSQIVKESRGIILDEANNWEVIARGFDRFFNYDDSVAAKINWEKASIQTKMDGSLILCFFYDGQWNAATSGMPDGAGLCSLYGKSYAEMFWDFFEQQTNLTKEDHKPYLNGWENFTFIFEMCSFYNQIVVMHDKPQLYLLGGRSNKSGMESEPWFFSHLFPNIPRPDSFLFSSERNLFDIINVMDGSKQEGFVAVHYKSNGVDRVKIKCADYVMKHRFTNNLISHRLILDNVIKKGEADEIISAFPHYKDLILDIKNRYENLILNLKEEYDKIKHIENQKEFALAAKKIDCNGALFALRSGHIKNVKEFVDSMITKNLIKYLGLKDEIIEKE